MSEISNFKLPDSWNDSTSISHMTPNRSNSTPNRNLYTNNQSQLSHTKLSTGAPPKRIILKSTPSSLKSMQNTPLSNPRRVTLSIARKAYDTPSSSNKIKRFTMNTPLSQKKKIGRYSQPPQQQETPNNIPKQQLINSNSTNQIIPKKEPKKTENVTNTQSNENSVLAEKILSLMTKNIPKKEDLSLETITNWDAILPAFVTNFLIIRFNHCYLVARSNEDIFTNK